MSSLLLDTKKNSKKNMKCKHQQFTEENHTDISPTMIVEDSNPKNRSKSDEVVFSTHDEEKKNDDEIALIDLLIIAIIKQLERQKLYALLPSSTIKKEIQFFEESINQNKDLLSIHSKDAIIQF